MSPAAVRQVSPHVSTISVARSEPVPLRAVALGEFLTMELPTRETLLRPWLPAQGLVMVHASRGTGKTFFGLGVAVAVASGGEFLGWKAPSAKRVLYLDGEMPAISMQERLQKIVAGMQGPSPDPDSFHLITPDLQETGMPNLADTEERQRLDPHIECADLIIVDNVSTLCRGGRENEAEGWQGVQDWLLLMRSVGKSVLLIHHSGKGGAQRGTSKREDILDTVISLRHPADYSPQEGAHFEVHFEKSRGFCGEDARGLDVKISADETGVLSWATRTQEACTFDRVVALTNDGLSAGEVVVELGVNKSTVSRHLKKARAEGLIAAAEAPRYVHK